MCTHLHTLTPICYTYIPTDFCLSGAKRLYNIFHPFDPVAFRLEPLVCNTATTLYREPEILPTWQGGLRVHYQVPLLFLEVYIYHDTRLRFQWSR
jgi:DDHD domain